MEVEIAEEKINAIEEDEEEVEEVVEEEVEEGFEEVVEEQVEEEEGGGGDGGESVEKGVDNVDSAGDEIKQSDHVSGSSSSLSSGKIFVGGVAWETTEETFTMYFNKYGEITDSVIMKDKHTQKPRGFGFVTFADPSVIDSVLAEGHVIDGRTVEVKRTVPREEAAPTKGGGGRSFKTKKIFVGGIPTSLTEDEFKEHFASYGKVVEHQIMLDHSTGRSRGFGFVTFEDEESVEKVISKGKMQDLGGKQVEIKKAEPKKAGGDSSYNGRGAAAYGGGGGMYGGAGMYGYGGGYGSGAAYYGGGGGYGYGSGGSGYGMGFAPGVDGAMYAGGGGYGYGAPGGYTAGSYGYGGQSRGYGNRYHPYGR